MGRWIAESKRAERDRRSQRRAARRVEGHVVDVPVFEVVKWDWQERVQDPTADHAPVSVVESFGVGEVRI